VHQQEHVGAHAAASEVSYPPGLCQNASTLCALSSPRLLAEPFRLRSRRETQCGPGTKWRWSVWVPPRLLRPRLPPQPLPPLRPPRHRPRPLGLRLLPPSPCSKCFSGPLRNPSCCPRTARDGYALCPGHQRCVLCLFCCQCRPSYVFPADKDCVGTRAACLMRAPC